MFCGKQLSLGTFLGLFWLSVAAPNLNALLLQEVHFSCPSSALRKCEEATKEGIWSRMMSRRCSVHHDIITPIMWRQCLHHSSVASCIFTIHHCYDVGCVYLFSPPYKTRCYLEWWNIHTALSGLLSIEQVKELHGPLKRISPKSSFLLISFPSPTQLQTKKTKHRLGLDGALNHGYWNSDSTNMSYSTTDTTTHG